MRSTLAYPFRAHGRWGGPCVWRLRLAVRARLTIGLRRLSLLANPCDTDISRQQTLDVRWPSTVPAYASRMRTLSGCITQKTPAIRRRLYKQKKLTVMVRTVSVFMLILSTVRITLHTDRQVSWLSFVARGAFPEQLLQ